MKKRKLEIIGLSNSQTQSNAFALILGEVGGTRRLPIVIGQFEASAIAIELENIKPNRPLTHDLLKNFAQAYGIVVKEVIINKFSEGIFFSIIVCDNGTTEIEIDARTSDAVALAVRFKCEIFAYESVLASAGVEGQSGIFGKSDIKSEESDLDAEPDVVDKGFMSYSTKQLEDMLKKAVDNEDYERASLIRDEIARRKKDFQ